MFGRFSISTLLVVACLLGTAAADDAPPKTKDEPTASDMTPDREQSALRFVKKNHPELSELLSQLKTANGKEYQRAMRDLSRASERVEQWREKDAERYAMELELWKLRSRIELLAARLQMGDSPELRRQLHSALEKQASLRLQLLELERSKALSRIERLDRQIELLKANRDKTINNQLRTLKVDRPKTEKPKPEKAKPEPAKADNKKTDKSKAD